MKIKVCDKSPGRQKDILSLIPLVRLECSNPGIDQYLRKQEIRDPESHIRYWIEKTHRGEVLDMFAGTLLDNSTD